MFEIMRNMAVQKHVDSEYNDVRFVDGHMWGFITCFLVLARLLLRTDRDGVIDEIQTNLCSLPTEDTRSF